MSSSANTAPGKSTNVRTKDVLPVRVVGALLRGVARLAPELAAAGYERLFLHTRRHRTPEREKPWMDGARDFSVACGTHRLQAWSWGDAPRPAVLLVHGWEGRGSQMGAFVRPLLDAGLRVVTFDHPGHGASTGRSSSIVEMANAVLHIGREVGPLAGIVAHSAGGAATSVALRHLPKIERLVYVAVPADAGRFLFDVGKMLGLPEAVVLRTRKRIERRFNVEWPTLSSVGLAPRMDTPLLLIHDRGDKEVPWEAGRELADAWPNSRLVSTEDLGHRRILYTPDVVDEAVRFLTGDATVSTPVRAEVA